jgi:hypothetical protein
VLLDVSELEVDKIHLKVRNLRVHVPPKACRPQEPHGRRTRQAIIALQPFSLAYSAERVEGAFSELRPRGFLRSSRKAFACGIMGRGKLDPAKAGRSKDRHE